MSDDVFLNQSFFTKLKMAKLKINIESKSINFIKNHTNIDNKNFKHTQTPSRTTTKSTRINAYLYYF